MNNLLILGILLHAIGGIAAATCFTPQRGCSKWSYQSFWLLMCLFSWVVMPLAVAFITVPRIGEIVSQTPTKILVIATLLGMAYGVGGMTFGLSIHKIGYSLTYAIAIGVSAVFGTALPMLVHLKKAGEGAITSQTHYDIVFTSAQLQEKFNFTSTGGKMLIIGSLVTIIGIAVCGWAGFTKEKEVKEKNREEGTQAEFHMTTGLFYSVLAGLLAAVFSIGLGVAAPITELANIQLEEAGRSTIFNGFPAFIFVCGGSFLTNFIVWSIVHTRKNTWKEYVTPMEGGKLSRHWIFGILAGVLWFVQFIFYQFGHWNMDQSKSGFMSWGFHMAMLVFFSFGTGLVLKEWKGCKKTTVVRLLAGLALLFVSFVLIGMGLR